MRECDVVMKGGITSGVVYPLALVEFSRTYRLHSLGGASAGAIGAALGAAAEFGRASGGFERLARIPAQLGDGRLAALFQPQPATRALLPLLLAATGHDRPGPGRAGAARVLGVLGAVVRGFPFASIVGLSPGVLLAAWGALAGGTPAARVLLTLAGVLLAVVGWLAAVLVRLNRKLTIDVPANQFGICRGVGAGDDPGFTDWLADRLDELAGRDPAGPPLTFGQLSAAGIDLRMISTCLSQARPYELPWDGGGFFFDPAVWAGLFPQRVVDALRAAPPARPLQGGAAIADWEAEEAEAARHTPPLLRLPAAEHLPVIVATRLSLSFPLLISAIPLWTIDRRAKTGRPRFVQVWFTDGGLCSNFPVQLFDAALPGRPTFAINLGDFPEGTSPSPDQTQNIEYARNNRSGLLPELVEVAPAGWAAVTGFATAAIDTARSWQDGTQLSMPGYRDRIVRVLQTPAEGGLNLFMDAATIEGLAERGRVAAAAMVAQFDTPHYPDDEHAFATGWENHRWVRYRALLSGLPAWLASYRNGRPGLEQLVANPPSYKFGTGKALAGEVTAKLDDLAAALDPSDGTPTPGAVKDLASQPAPVGVIRRVPRI
jgi:predicted acylesterase/phospholipase RssA